MENTNSLLFLFFIFLFLIAVAIYSLRWWKGNHVEQSHTGVQGQSSRAGDVDYVAFNDSDDTSSLVSGESRSNTTLLLDDEIKVQETTPLSSANGNKPTWERSQDSSPK